MPMFPEIPVTLTAMMIMLAGCSTPPDVPGKQTSAPAALPIAQDGPCCGPVTSKAQQLLQVLDASDVENLWQKSTHVAWDSGKPDMSPSDEQVFSKLDHKDTHCAAFAASMAQRVGV
jgi:hypothetical protein